MTIVMNGICKRCIELGEEPEFTTGSIADTTCTIGGFLICDNCGAILWGPKFLIVHTVQLRIERTHGKGQMMNEEVERIRKYQHAIEIAATNAAIDLALERGEFYIVELLQSCAVAKDIAQNRLRRLLIMMEQAGIFAAVVRFPPYEGLHPNKGSVRRYYRLSMPVDEARRAWCSLIEKQRQGEEGNDVR